MELFSLRPPKRCNNCHNYNYYSEQHHFHLYSHRQDHDYYDINHNDYHDHDDDDSGHDNHYDDCEKHNVHDNHHADLSCSREHWSRR